jgi:hypothetical protein
MKKKKEKNHAQQIRRGELALKIYININYRRRITKKTKRYSITD